MDEVGATVQIEVKTPKAIINLKDSIAKIKLEKIEVVKSQDYEKAADLRDVERKLLDKR